MYIRDSHGRIQKGSKPFNTGQTKYQVISGKKRCKDCRKWKTLTNFYVSINSSGGVSNQCKSCRYRQRKESWEQEKLQVSKYRRTPSGYYTVLRAGNSWRIRSGKAKYKVLISRKQFIKWYNRQPKKCFYCDMPENLLVKIKEIARRSFGRYFYQMTIDRKDNEQAYKLGNIVLACPICNLTKGSIFTAEEFILLAQQFIKPKWIGIKEEPRDARTQN